MRKLLVLSLIFSNLSFADNGTNLLLKTDGNDIDISSKIKTVKQLDLSDAFLVQLFGSWKAQGALSHDMNNWVNLVLYKDFKEAYKTLHSIFPKASPKFQKTIQTTELYLLYRLGLNNLFINKWIDLSANESLLTSEVGLALDHVVSNDISNLLISSGYQLSVIDKNNLSKIESIDSRINASLQSWKALRSGKDALKWISKLSENDPLRVELTKTSLIAFARSNELKASAKLIKEVFEPIIEKSTNTDEISNYYLTLGRLLYQAGAMEASRDYYNLIPESSKFYLTARTEIIWAMLRMNDLSAVKGELATLKMDLFNDKFYPEIYLVSAIANLKTCQFTEVKNNFREFLKTNRIWANTIGENLVSPMPSLVSNDFYYQGIINNLKSLKFENDYLVNLKSDFTQDLSRLSQMNLLVLNNQKIELIRKWDNREKILTEAIYKMRFVKIEFISRMRDFSLALNNTQDSVSTYSAATARDNQLQFPYDGKTVWSDELFNMTAEVENLCLQGLK